MELYHVLNRGVDKRDIFLDTADRMRFVSALELFNDTIPAENTHRIINGINVGPTRSNKEPLVQIHAWCLMKNHYHLLLSEVVEGGLTKFLMKLNVGHAKYFNERYQRSGTLFQGRTKKVRITTDAHFLYILHYIHLNPLDFMNGAQQWREQKVTDAVKALEYLEGYKWSSYKDYSGEPIFPNITTTEFFKEVFNDYPKILKRYLKDLELSDLKPLLLE
jgi:putative transposase